MSDGVREAMALVEEALRLCAEKNTSGLPKPARWVALTKMWSANEPQFCMWCGGAAANRSGDKADHKPDCPGMDAIASEERGQAAVALLAKLAPMVRTALSAPSVSGLQGVERIPESQIATCSRCGSKRIDTFPRTGDPYCAACAPCPCAAHSRAGAGLREVATGPAWRREAPTEPGWYWFRGERQFHPLAGQRPFKMDARPVRVSRGQYSPLIVDTNGDGVGPGLALFIGEWAPCPFPSSALTSTEGAALCGEPLRAYLRHCGSCLYCGMRGDAPLPNSVCTEGQRLAAVKQLDKE